MKRKTVKTLLIFFLIFFSFFSIEFVAFDSKYIHIYIQSRSHTNFPQVAKKGNPAEEQLRCLLNVMCGVSARAIAEK